ncbi:hypothetical protein [Fundicoccus culcitae]|uniref:DUF1659 domain-containing protein n=1 Tax=Fundicoccus culcitae TaxID=2969821 RepID=A0ABY5P8R1_9LACT|nr:hypothetical protein [Fundicoccus culcitae]UUX35059.1 hypothetical protein NRE15_05300 [Fundicoccus culcitae]
MPGEKEFVSSSLQFKTVGVDEKVKLALTLPNLANQADHSQMIAVRDALQSVFTDAIAETIAVEVYAIY